LAISTNFYDCEIILIDIRSARGSSKSSHAALIRGRLRKQDAPRTQLAVMFSDIYRETMVAAMYAEKTVYITLRSNRAIPRRNVAELPTRWYLGPIKISIDQLIANP